jgi:hypothetical protein
MTKFENSWGIHTGGGYFRAKPSPVWIPQEFSNLVIFHLPAYEDGTECSETSEYKIQTPGNCPEENIQLSFNSVPWIPAIYPRAVPVYCITILFATHTFCLHWRNRQVLAHMQHIKTLFSKYSNIYPTRCNVALFILYGNCSTYFGWYHHPILRSANNCIYSICYLSHRYSGRQQ